MTLFAENLKKENVEFAIEFEEGLVFYKNRCCQILNIDDLIALKLKIQESINYLSSKNHSNEDIKEWNDWNKSESLKKIKSITNKSNEK